MFTPEQFKNLDLRSQLTEELKEKWYYKNYKDALKINKHSVIFDDDFKFTVEYTPAIVADKTEVIEIKKDVVFEGVVIMKKGEVIHRTKGEELSSAYVAVIHDGEVLGCNFYEYGEKYADDPEEILENILLYIANYI